MYRFLMYLTPTPWNINKGIRLLGPMIEERLNTERERGADWEGRPVCLPVNMLLCITDYGRCENDLLSWLLDEAPPGFRTVPDLTRRILMTNFAAIHTTSIVSHICIFGISLRFRHSRALCII